FEGRSSVLRTLLRPHSRVGAPFAASRVSDERSGSKRRTALDPAPGTRRRTCPEKLLDNADAIIDVLQGKSMQGE
ncbi:MAG: hypothetical protein ACRD1O_08600, partial [Terriglobia bacterium]